MQEFKIVPPLLCTSKCNCKEGSWKVLWWENNKQKLRHFKNQELAFDFYTNMKYEIENKIAVIEDKRLTFKQFLDKAILTFNVESTQKYQKSLQNIIDVRLMPFFKNIRLEDITAAVVQEYIQGQFAKGYAKNSVNKDIVLLRRILDQAIRDRLINFNFAKLVKVTQTRKNVKALKTTEINQLVEACDNCCLGAGHYAELDEKGKFKAAGGTCFSPYGSFILAMATLGLRISEATALQWKHINFDNNTVRIEQSHSYSYEGTPFIKEPKTEAGKRNLPLPKKLKERLYVESIGKGPEDFVFTTATGKHIRTNFNAKFKELIVKVGLDKDITCHSLRHTYAALLRKTDVSIHELSKRMGHASVKITEDWYGAWYDDNGQSFINDFDKIYESESN